MHKFKYILVFILGLGLLKSQNLVPNGDFELYSSCPNNVAQINYALGWDAYSGSPDYLNICAPTASQISVPNNFGGYQQAASGNAYAGLGAYFSGTGWREFSGRVLSNPLTIGIKYYVSFKVSLSIVSPLNLNCASNNIGAMFSTIPYNQTNPAPITNNPKVYTTTVITDSSNWTRIAGSFIADSAFTHVIIGNFFTNNLTDTLIMDGAIICKTAYYYLDDVCVSTDSLTCNGAIGIETYNISKQNIKIYPNPAQNKAFYEITLKDNESGFIQLYNVLGNEVSSKELKRGFNKAEFDLSKINDGVYMYKVIINAEIRGNNKLIITK